MKLYYHPLSSYSQKTLLAFYEKDLPFTPALVDVLNPSAKAAYAREIHPLGKVPLLEVEGTRIAESSIIAEWIDSRHPASGVRLLPVDPDLQLEVRRLDRMADFYLNEPMQKVLFDAMRPADERDPFGVERARALLDIACSLLDAHLAAGGPWLAGATFSLADCAAIPALFYLQRVHPFTRHERLAAYANRAFERPSWKKVFAEAAPHLLAFQRA